MPPRRFIALLVAGVLLVAGFTAAAIASGGNPFDASAERSTTDQTATGQTGLDQTTTSEETTPKAFKTGDSNDEEAENESDDDETAGEKTATSSTAAEHKVTICHHTGSTKHRFHPITVDEHAVTAHTNHGDTVGPCATTTGTSTGLKHAKQKHASGKRHGFNRPHRHGKRAGEK